MVRLPSILPVDADILVRRPSAMYGRRPRCKGKKTHFVIAITSLGIPRG
jgi:hypothetical protein